MNRLIIGSESSKRRSMLVILKKNPRCLFIACGLLWVLISCSEHQTVIQTIPLQIVPKPSNMTLLEGRFQFDGNTVFVVSNPMQGGAAEILIQKMNTATSWNLKTTPKRPPSNYIWLKEDNTLAAESYILKVDHDDITISAGDRNGFIYGIQTLRQLLPAEIETHSPSTEKEWYVPRIEITDSPRFEWRGFMLDVARHFFKKEQLKKLIENLSFHKINRLHLHLVDDQGWRLEIKKYPKLTEVGSWRVNQEHLHWKNRRTTEPHEKGTYGGFYTQEDMKEIVAHAKQYGIEIVPEIEMPAHVSSGIASYPHLSCFEQPIGVPSGGLWPITDIYCAGKETTFEFLEDVLAEVSEIFPSKYVHIGGDEATKTNWESCEHCTRRMAEHGLGSTEELQAYFIQRVQKYLKDINKQLIGWDEITEGGLPNEAIVMSWRGMEGGIQAAKQGHPVIMSPASHTYFDFYQGLPDKEPTAFDGFTPISKVYEFDPVDKSLTEMEAERILGGQANLWTEYVTNPKHMEYMTFPRVAAISEALWTPEKKKSWDDFSNRLPGLLNRYGLMQINYAKSAYAITASKVADAKNKTIAVSLKNELAEADIRYTINGGQLIKYETPIEIKETTALHAVLYENDSPTDITFKDTILFHKAIGKNVGYTVDYNKNYQGTGAYGLVNGIRGSKNFHDGNWQGWFNKALTINIDLQENQPIENIAVGSMASQSAEIHYPQRISIAISSDAKTFQQVKSIWPKFESRNGTEITDFEFSFDETMARYIQISIEPLQGVENVKASWVFLDEILVN